MWYNKYCKAKFKEKGRGPDFYDCWGLVMDIYKNDHPKNIILPGYGEFYETTTEKQDIIKISSKIHTEAIKWEKIYKPKEFDVILSNMRGVAMHVGVIIKPGVMIHCSSGTDVSISNYNTIRWKNKIKGFYRNE